MQKLIWIDPQSQSEHPITRITDVNASGQFIGIFASGVRGAFLLKDCRTA